MSDIKRENGRILVLAEIDDGRVAPITFGLLGMGKRLAEDIRGTLCVAVLGNAIHDISNEITNFSEEVYSLDHSLLGEFQVDLYAHALEGLCRNIRPYVMIIGHTLDNLDLAPRLAHKIGTDLITDCIHLDIEPEGKHLLCTKPVYGENALATFTIEKKPLMVTLRPGTMTDIGRCQVRGKIIPFELTIDRSVIKVESVEKILGESVSLDKADAIVAGGRGIKKIEGLECLQDLMGALKRYFSKVELGASRPLIDAGWLPHSRQLGSTGEKASPQLYIAIGISGASQHLSGVVGSKKIIAINKDGEAPIFDSADYGVVDEYEKIVPPFVEKLKDLS